MKEAMNLSLMLEQCRNGERGLPSYEELAAIATPATASGDELPSIATDEFKMLLRAHRVAYQTAVDGFDPSDEKEVDENLHTAWKALVAHIDAHTRAVSAATKPTADLSKLTRYRPESYAGADWMESDIKGEFVKLADVQSLLATKPAAEPQFIPPAAGQYVTDQRVIDYLDKVRDAALNEAEQACKSAIAARDAFRSEGMDKCDCPCVGAIAALKSASQPSKGGSNA